MQQVSNKNHPTYSHFSVFKQQQFPTYYGEYGPYGSYTNLPVESSENETVNTAGKAIFLQALTLGLEKLSNYFSNKLVRGQEFTTEQNVMNIANDMVRKNNLNVHVGLIDEFNKANYSEVYGNAKEFDIIAKGQNAFYADELKIAVAPKSKPSMILHELGHAINAKGRFTKILQQSRRYALYAPTALLLANKITKNQNSNEQSFIEKHAALLGFCAFLPTIFEEGLASFRGIKAAKSKLGNISNLSILKKNYAIALCTYILSGIGLGVAAKQTIDEK